MEWYLVFGIGLFFSIIVYRLFSGPLRFLLTLNIQGLEEQTATYISLDLVNK